MMWIRDSSSMLVVASLAALTVSGCGGDDSPHPIGPSNTSNTAGTTQAEVERQAAHQPPQAITNSIGMKLTRIPAGVFLMGSADTDPGARDDESPRHRVRISKPFYMGVYEVTQAEFMAMMETNPSSFTRDGLLKDAPADLDCSRLPVDNVTWYAAVEFCRRLSKVAAEARVAALSAARSATMRLRTSSIGMFCEPW